MTQEDIVILSQLLDQKFEPVYTRLDLLESDVRELKSGMSEIKQRVASVEQKVTELDQRVASVEQKVTKLEQKVTELDQRVAGVEQKVTELDEKVTELDQKFTVLDEKVTVLDQKFTVLDQKFTVLDQKFTVLDEKVTGLELVIENETNVNIRRIAEGHCDLVRNLREARKVDDEKELLKKMFREICGIKEDKYNYQLSDVIKKLRKTLWYVFGKNDILCRERSGKDLMKIRKNDIFLYGRKMLFQMLEILYPRRCAVCDEIEVTGKGICPLCKDKVQNSFLSSTSGFPHFLHAGSPATNRLWMRERNFAPTVEKSIMYTHRERQCLFMRVV